MHIHENTQAPCTRAHTPWTLAGVYAHALAHAHTRGPRCSERLQYWTQTQAWSLYLHVNGIQQSVALFVCSVPPVVWARERELVVRWRDHIRWAPMVMKPSAPKREGRGWVTGSHWNSRDSHIAWKGSMDWSPSLTAEQERDEKDKENGLPVQQLKCKTDFHGKVGFTWWNSQLNWGNLVRFLEHDWTWSFPCG